jgi:quinol---cytochrome c reductase iron-sulfur subunit
MTTPPGDHDRPELAPVVAFVVAMLAALGAAVVYWRGGQTQLEGILLGACLLGIGIGMVLWAKRFMSTAQVTEPRGQIGSTEQEQAQLAQDFAEHDPLTRRRLLTRLLGGALGALGLAALFPIRSLGPRPGSGLKQTAYSKGGLRLVTDDGDPITLNELSVNGVVTVWPDGHIGDEDSQTLLLRLEPGVFQPRPGREGWSPDDHVAFSKVCTHAGCPVGLYEEQTEQLLCPCHQSTFDVADACRPVFGPATRSLPQLPLGTDDDGYLVATGDFSDPVGPGFWDRGR